MGGMGVKGRVCRLKRIKVVVTLILCFVILLSSAFSGVRVLHAADTPRRAVITAMEGSVLVQASGQATAVPARRNMEIKSGDRIITGKDGSCTIRYDDGCTTHIGPNSRVDMTNLTRQGADGPDTTILGAQRGTLWNNAKDVMARNSRFEVNTPSAIAAVRGTFFKSIVLPNGDTLFIVLGGGLYISPAASDEGDDGGDVPPPSGEGVFVGGGEQLGVSSGEELPDSAVPLDYNEIDNATLLYLAQDNPDIFVELIENAAAQGETEFLERVNQLLEDNEDMQENLGDKLETVQQTVTQGTSQPPATPGGDDPDDIYYTLTVNVRPDGSGTVTGGGSYAAGTKVKLAATPEQGYEFVSWTVNGTVVSEEPEFLYTMTNKNVTVTANFTLTIPEPVQLIVAPYVLPWNYEGWFFFIEASETGTWQEDESLESLFIRVMQRPADPDILPSQPAMIDDQPVEPEIYELFKDKIYFQLPEGLEEGAYVIQVTPAGEPQNVIAAGVFHVVELEGNGVPGDPYIVETPEELDLVRYFLDAHFELGDNINLDVAPYNAGPGWLPIGNGEAFFSGTFNGNGRTIGNLYTNRPEEDGVGLFGYVCDGAAIKNATLFDPIVSGWNNVGALVGGAEAGSAISNITVTSGEISGNSSIGALVGHLHSSTVLNIQSSANVSGCNDVGGIIGYSYGSVIKQAVSTGDVSGNSCESCNIGGIIGRAFDEEYEGVHSISNSYASGTVSGYESVGGLVGGGIVDIVNSYATGQVEGTDSIGGLIGTFYDGTINYNFALNSQIVRSNGNSINFGRIVGLLLGEPNLLYNYARYDMEEPFGGAFTEKYCSGKDGADLSCWRLNDDGALPVIGATSSIWAGEIDPVVEIVIVGDTFDYEEVDNTENWSITVGDSVLSVSSIEKDEYCHSVTIAFDGEVGSDAVIEIQALAGALSGDTPSNVISVGPMWVSIPGFSEGAADYINLKVGYDQCSEALVPYVAYYDNLNNQVNLKRYNYQYGSWENLGVPESAGASYVSLYVDDGDVCTPYVAYSDPSLGGKTTVRRVRQQVYGGVWEWSTVGDPGFSEVAASDISLHFPYMAYSNQSEGNVMVTVCEEVYEDYVWNCDLGFPEVAASDISLHFPYVAYSDASDGSVTVLCYDGEGDWDTVGNEAVTVNAASHFSLCCFDVNQLFVGYEGNPLDFMPIPFVAYRDQATGKITVTGFDYDDETWQDIGPSVPAVASPVSLASPLVFPGFFLAYIDSEGKARVMGLLPDPENGEGSPQWENLGGPVSEGQADDISLAVLEDYNEAEQMIFYRVFVAFKDMDNGGKVTVKEYQKIVNVDFHGI